MASSDPSVPSGIDTQVSHSARTYLRTPEQLARFFRGMVGAVARKP
jgi:hypothetical protein